MSPRALRTVELVAPWLIGGGLIAAWIAAGPSGWMTIGLVLLIAVVQCLVVGVRYVRRRFIRCSHGVLGARANSSLCAQCAREAERRQAKLKAEADRQAAEDLSRRQREYDEYRSRIRLPRYLSLMDPYEFEHLVCEVFRSRGYKVQETPASGDDGVDGFLRSQGKLYLLQCKRVKGGVGAPVVRDLYGAMTHENADGGFLVTTGSASDSARRWASGKPIEIIELGKLSDMVRSTFPENEVVPDSFQPAVTPERETAPIFRRRRRYHDYRRY